jgi:hypothetical protein
MKYCEQCGTQLETGARFCQSCGFATSPDQPASISPAPANPQPKAISKPKPEPVAEPKPPVRQPKPPKQPLMKSWVLIALIVFGVIALGAAGWIIISRNKASSKDTTAETIVNKDTTQTSAPDSTALSTKIVETPKAAVPEEPKVQPKPPVKTEKKKTSQAPKETVKEQEKPAQETVAPPKEAKAEPEEVKAKTDAKDETVKVIFEVGRKEDPKNKGPKNPTKLIIRKPTMIVRITTDHFNDGSGTTSAGSIIIKDRDGNTVGTFNTKGKAGANGTPNSKWVAEPVILLEKGTYFISDSDIPTWSKTLFGIGMVEVEGYEKQ